MQEYTIHDRVQAEQNTGVTEASLTVPEIGPWLGKAYTAVAEVLARQGIEPTGPPFARYRPLEGGSFRVEAGFPVDAVITAAGEVHSAVLPGGTVAATVHIGPYDAMEPAYAAIIAWIKARDGEPVGDPWETYLSDPGEHPDPATWRTEISQPYRSAGTTT